MVNKSSTNVDGDRIRSALTAAKSIPTDDFRHQEQAWLGLNLAPLLSATEAMHPKVVNEHGIDNADAALQGALLGGAVVRSLIEDGRVSVDECTGNFRDRLTLGQGLVYDGKDMDDEVVAGVIGQDAVDAIREIKTPVSQVMCSMVLEFALVPRRDS